MTRLICSRKARVSSSSHSRTNGSAVAINTSLALRAIGRMAKRDSKHAARPLSIFQDTEWLLGTCSLQEDVALPPGYVINPDETEDNSLVGPMRDKLIDMFEELVSTSLSEERIDSQADN